MWRFFLSDIERHAQDCRRELFCTEPFEIIGTRAGGGSIAFPVRLKGSGLRAWVKPAVAAGDNAHTAAHEKICADLGHALGLPVAPVLLSRETKGHGLPNIVALSFAALKQPAPWNQVMPALLDGHRKMLAPALSGIFGFHAWIDDHDHNWNEGNALFECEADGTGRAVFYDYGHSLMHQWKPPAPAPIRNWDERNGPFRVVGTPEIPVIIKQIEQFPPKDLEAIINRIPAECMPPDLGKALIDALVGRRAELRKLLKLAGAP